MTLNRENQSSHVSALLERFEKISFNVFVERAYYKKGKLVMAEEKFCSRKIKGTLTEKNGQVSIPLVGGGSIAWDLNCEDVVIGFEKKDIVICRLLEKRQRRKILRLTTNPI